MLHLIFNHQVIIITIIKVNLYELILMIAIFIFDFQKVHSIH